MKFEDLSDYVDSVKLKRNLRNRINVMLDDEALTSIHSRANYAEKQLKKLGVTFNDD